MRTYSMASHKRKNHQRWLNRYCRHVNKSIENDDLWLGRFYISQNRTKMEWFDDGSGGLIYVELMMHDRKTGITKTKWYDALGLEWQMWWDLNDFIIKDCKVWEEIPSVRENRIDFRNKRQKEP